MNEEQLIGHLHDVVNAWERLEVGKNYPPKVIEKWLVNQMKPVIDHTREILKKIG